VVLWQFNITVIQFNTILIYLKAQGRMTKLAQIIAAQITQINTHKQHSKTVNII
jgi:hypothetical protein